MITKGIIKTLDYENNSCTVNVPLFENPGDSFPPTLTKVLFLNQPGIYNGYKIGDTVVIDFIDNDFSQPIILGKLFTGITSESLENQTGTVSCHTLTVKNKVILPKDTLIDNVKVGDIVEKLSALVDRVNTNEAKLQ